MSDAIDAWVAAAESAEDPDIGPLTDHVRRERASNPLVTLGRSRHSSAWVRRAFALALEPPVTAAERDALWRLTEDSETSVRLEAWKAAARLGLDASDAVMLRALSDAAHEARVAAVRMPAAHTRHAARVAAMLRSDTAWQVREAAAKALADVATTFFEALLTAVIEDHDSDVRREAALAAEGAMARLQGHPPGSPTFAIAALTQLKPKLAEIGLPRVPRLNRWVVERMEREADEQKLREFGTLLTDEARAGRLRPVYGYEDALSRVGRILDRAELPRAVLLVGPPGVGKTGLVHTLARQFLRPDAAATTYVLRLTGADALSGTQYVGEWQTRVQNLIRAISAPKKVVLFVPSLLDLLTAGRSSKGDENVVAVLAPHLERGAIAVVAECSPQAYRTLVTREPSILRLFEVVQLAAANRDETRAIVDEVAAAEKLHLVAGVRDRAIELADEYLLTIAQPGAAIDLLLRARSATNDETPLTVPMLLATLSSSTGIPVEFLDDSIPLDRKRARDFLEARVMGQREAIDAVLERVALLKAGLTDPDKPFGVLLFVGPTGVGKTELARALAELLFGDPGRLVRLDMSEFATYESYERLLGGQGRPGLLTGAVRTQPFSVVLLDEIEKAHQNVFDVCLQLFDAGRLTDGDGVTSDYRRSLIILTSNVGATSTRGRAVGFGGERVEDDADGGAAHTERELALWFRPEFLNRLDRVVRFQPLDPQVVANIARKELRRVLERSGILRRRIALDLDPSLVALLLQQGFSPSFGARPLKRTVERSVLLPVAWALSGGEVPEGSTVRLTARNGRVHVHVVAPHDGDRDDTKEREATVERVDALRERARGMLAEMVNLREASVPLTTRLSACIAASSAPGFYGDPRAARVALDEIYRLDGARRAMDELYREVRELAERSERMRGEARDITALSRRIRSLEGRLTHVRFLVTCDDIRALGDVYLTLTAYRRAGSSLHGVAQLARMYQAFAARRGLESEVVDDRLDEENGDDTITLLISGSGAHALFSGEAGIHKLARGDRSSGTYVQEVVRVEPMSAPIEEPTIPKQSLSIEVRHCNRKGRLVEAITLEVDLMHRPTLQPLRAWCAGTREWALERLLPLLMSRLEASGAGAPEGDRVVRRYVLGPISKVRDMRTGRVTSRLDRVLRGYLDEFVVVES